MERRHQIIPLKIASDLTEENLSTLFRKHFSDQNLSVEIQDENKKFLDENDNFQSEIRKCHLRIKNSMRSDINRDFRDGSFNINLQATNRQTLQLIYWQGRA